MFKLKAFSLAEVVIALLIVSIIMAVSTPLVTVKKNKDPFLCYWKVLSSKPSDIYFSSSGDGKVSIGTDTAVDSALLTIGNKYPTIAFKNGDSNKFINVGSNLILGANLLSDSQSGNILIGNLPNSDFPIDSKKFCVTSPDNNMPILYGQCPNNNYDNSYVVIPGRLFVGLHKYDVNEIDNETYAHLKINGNIKATAASISDLSGGSLEFSSGAMKNLTISTGTTTNPGTLTVDKINCSVATFDSDVILNGSTTFKSTNPVVVNHDLTVKGQIYGTLSSNSDFRLKDIIGHSNLGLKELREMNIYDFTWKNKKDKKLHTSIIAQELEKILPDCVSKNDDGFLTININDILFIAINALKQLDIEVTSLKNENRKLKNENMALNNKLENLNQRLLEVEKHLKIKN